MKGVVATEGMVAEMMVMADGSLAVLAVVELTVKVAVEEAAMAAEVTEGVVPAAVAVMEAAVAAEVAAMGLAAGVTEGVERVWEVFALIALCWTDRSVLVTAINAVSKKALVASKAFRLASCLGFEGTRSVTNLRAFAIDGLARAEVWPALTRCKPRRSACSSFSRRAPSFPRASTNVRACSQAGGGIGGGAGVAAADATSELSSDGASRLGRSEVIDKAAAAAAAVAVAVAAASIPACRSKLANFCSRN